MLFFKQETAAEKRNTREALLRLVECEARPLVTPSCRAACLEQLQVGGRL